MGDVNWVALSSIAIGIAGPLLGYWGVRTTMKGNLAAKSADREAAPYKELADRADYLERMNRILNRLVILWEDREADWHRWARQHAPDATYPDRNPEMDKLESQS